MLNSRVFWTEGRRRRLTSAQNDSTYSTYLTFLQFVCFLRALTNRFNTLDMSAETGTIFKNWHISAILSPFWVKRGLALQKRAFFSHTTRTAKNFLRKRYPKSGGVAIYLSVSHSTLSPSIVTFASSCFTRRDHGTIVPEVIPNQAPMNTLLATSNPWSPIYWFTGRIKSYFSHLSILL